MVMIQPTGSAPGFKKRARMPMTAPPKMYIRSPSNMVPLHWGAGWRREGMLTGCAAQHRGRRPAPAPGTPSCPGLVRSAAAVLAVLFAACACRAARCLAALARLVVAGDHPRDAGGDPLAHRDVQEFVGTVRVRMRAQHA